MRMNGAARENSAVAAQREWADRAMAAIWRRHDRSSAGLTRFAGLSRYLLHATEAAAR